jgi:hypothetical protein
VLLHPFAQLLQTDTHGPLAQRVVEEVFGAALEGAEGGRACHTLPSTDAIELKKPGFHMHVDDVTGIGPSISCLPSPRHRMPFNARNVGSE